MAVDPKAYELLVGGFKNMFSPQQPAAGASMYDQARYEAQRNAMSRLGMGLVAAAIPQTAAQRVQSMQAALGGFGDIGTATYNAAQARLMAKQVEQAEASQKADEEFRAGLLQSGNIAPTVAPVTSAPMPMDGGFQIPSSAARLIAPPPPTAGVSSDGALNDMGITERQRQTLLRMKPSEQYDAYQKMLVDNSKPGSSMQPTKTPRYAADGTTLLGFDVTNDKGVYSFEPVPTDPAQAEARKSRETGYAQAMQIYYAPTGGLYTQGMAAQRSLGTIQEAKDAVKAGIFSGPTGFVRENAARLRSVFGLNDEALSNTAAFRSAAKAGAVQIMKDFGGNDTDREYREALDIVGGNTELTDAQIMRLLDLQERLAIKKYNQARDFGIKNAKLPADEQLPDLKEVYPEMFNGNAASNEKANQGIDIYKMSVDELAKANIDLTKLSDEELTYLRNKVRSYQSKPQVPVGN